MGTTFGVDALIRALTVQPGLVNSIELEYVPPPPNSDGALLVRARALGICGTDRAIVAGDYGWAPPGHRRLILGHESLGEVEAAPGASGFSRGDIIVGIVRRPDPMPCSACAVGEWDMCRNGLYTERGIKQRNGYGAERFRLEPEFAVKVDRSLGILGVLLEPTSVVAKAWDQVEQIGRRTHWWPRTVLVTGAGPIGLLAALLGKQRGFDIHVFDREEAGTKPMLVRELGGTYHVGDLGTLKPDIVMECTGAGSVVLEVIRRVAPDGIVCLTGVSSGGHKIKFDIGDLNREVVLENGLVFGSVNANRRHYQLAGSALADSNKDWLGQLITRRVPLSRWREALKRRTDDIKVVIDFTT